MLTLTIPKNEFWDSKVREFVYIDEQILELEHSLVSLTKWEQKYHKPFLSSEKTAEETLYYVRCMLLNDKSVDPKSLRCLTNENLQMINDYINDPMTATTIKEKKRGKQGNQIVTSELIYYWMTALQIPLEFENRHLNTLLTLIRVCSIKNAPTEKMSKKDIYERNRAVNEARKAKYKTKG